MLLTAALASLMTPEAALAEEINGENRTISTTVTYPGNLYVARSLDATLSIIGSGSVTNTNIGYIGFDAGVTGVATVTGGSASWTNDAALFVGVHGSGTLTIQNGASVSDAYGAVGMQIGGSGTVTVNGAGSTWTNTGVVDVGYYGTGSLTIADSASVTSTATSVATAAAGIGTLTLSGTGTSRGVLETGQVSEGLGSGTVIFSNGILRLTGDQVDLFSGFEDGDVTIASSARIDTNGYAVATSVGISGTGHLNKDGDGTLTLSGSSSYTGDTAVEGGRLAITGQVSGNRGYTANSVGSTAAVSVTGDDAAWTNSSYVVVGYAGDGTLTIADGASVSNTLAYVGNGAGSTGTVSVTGTGSTWTNSDLLDVGQSGAGTLTIADGASVSSVNGVLAFNNTATGAVTVTGAGSAWTNSGYLYVGRSGAGTLTIADGASVSNTLTSLGYNATGNGALTLSGTAGARGVLATGGLGEGLGSGTVTFDGGILRLTGNQTNLFSGFEAGDVTIDNGGAFIDTNGHSVATSYGLSGTGGLTKQGDGKLTLSGSSSYSGNTTVEGGTLAITGQLADYRGYIGHDSGTNGTVTVAGSAASWTNSSAIYVGHDGTGTLTISGGGSVDTTTSGFIGNKSGGTGTVTVTGSGSSWTTIAGILVGNDGTGTLTIAAGGSISGDTSYIGTNSGSSGTATVTGSGSTWTSGSALYVGFNGDGALAIENGASVSNTTGSVGYGAGSSGTVTVTGTGSTWTNTTGPLSVGGNGSGALTIADGATVSDLHGLIGETASGIGTVSVTGSGSSWMNSANLYVGNLGNGTLTIENGGSVNNIVGIIGNIASGIGTVSVTGSGSSWANSGYLSVGNKGTGGLTIENGAAVSNAAGYIGSASGSTGTVSVTGSGSSWTSSSDLYVGNNGAGTLSIADGASVSNTTGYIGSASGRISTVSVTGAGSSWTSSSDLYVGNNGAGTLSIADGASVSSTTTNVAYNATSSGTLTLSGTSVARGVLATGQVAEGSGSGTFTFDGGILRLTGNQAALFSGFEAGDVTIDDGGAFIDTNGHAVASAVSLSGSGGLTKEGDGTLTLTGSSSFAGNTTVDAGALVITGQLADATGAIGDGAGTTGAVTVAGNDASWTNSSALHIGNAGDGTLTVSDGASVVAPGIRIAYDNGSYGVLNIGAGFGDAAQAAGSVSADYVQFGSGLGALLFNHTDTDYQFDARIDGYGILWAQSGTTTLSQDSSGFTGQTTVNGGALVITGKLGGDRASIGDVPGSAAAVTVTGAGSTWTNSNALYVGNSGTGTLTLSDGATVGAPGVRIANDNGSNGVLNIGAAAADAAQAAGSLNAATIEFGSGTGTINFNHTETNYEFAAEISGDGTINQIAGVTKLSGDASGFIGTTNISAGSLYVNGALGGLVNNTGGTLGGSGTLGNIMIGSGSTLAPGNSIGAMSVASITFNSGSVYEVELNDGGFVAGVNNDVTNVVGGATINGGTVHVTPVNGTDDGSTYTPGTYTILTTVTGVTGTFEGVSNDFAFLKFALSYDPNNVYLTSSLPISTFCLSGMSANECAAGNAVFSLGSGSVYDAVSVLSNAEAPVALDLLSGEIHASARTALIEDSRFVREAAMARTRAVFDGVASNRVAEHQLSERLAFWGQGFGSWGDWDGDGNAASLDRSIGGLFLGGDARVSDDVRVGALAGYSQSSYSAAALMSSASVKSGYAALYGGGQWGALGLRAGGAYGWHGIETARGVAFTGFSDYLAASYDAATIQAFGEAAWRIDSAANTRLEPFANIAYVNLNADAFTETGGAAALSGNSDQTDAPFLTLGLRADTAFLLGQAKARLTGSLGWQHVFGDDVPVSLMTFVAGGSPFAIAGVPLAENVLAVDAGLGVMFAPDATLDLTYGGQFGADFIDQSVKGGINLKF